MDLVPALASIKACIELAVVAVEARDDARAKEAIGEMSRRLFDANLAALGMSERLLALRDQLDELVSQKRALEERLAHREKYVLRAIADGVFVRAYEPVDGDPTPAHYQCQICFDRGESSVLQLAAVRQQLTCRIDSKHSISIGHLDGMRWISIPGLTNLMAR